MGCLDFVKVTNPNNINMYHSPTELELLHHWLGAYSLFSSETTQDTLSLNDNGRTQNNISSMVISIITQSTVYMTLIAYIYLHSSQHSRLHKFIKNLFKRPVGVFTVASPQLP